MIPPSPTPQHHWLRQLLGDWVYQLPGPDATEGAPSCGPGRETGRAIGELWVQLEGEFTMPDGSPAYTVMTLGFNPATGRFTGTWVGSMMTHLWIYDGELNAEGTTLSLYSEGPDFQDPAKTARYKDVIELLPGGLRKLSGHCQNPDGSWQQFMETVYGRA
jgi:hypothetical protein